MSDLYGDVGHGLGTALNLGLITYCGVSFFNLQPKNTDQDYLVEKKKKDIFMTLLLITFIIIIIYYVINYTIIKKETEKSGWFDWLYFSLSLFMIILTATLIINLNSCPKIQSFGQGAYTSQQF
jgi:hypothetical protein